MPLQTIKNSIRNIPDYPKPGIQFKDITTALKDPKIFKQIIDLFVKEYKNQQIDYIVGIEARGFIFASALAYMLGCGFIPIRKSGKLPADVLSQEYELEYGTDKIEIHKDALQKGDKVLVIDDLLATGGTIHAAIKLIEQTEAQIIGLAFLIELKELGGRQKLEKFAPIFSLLES